MLFVERWVGGKENMKAHIFLFTAIALVTSMLLLPRVSQARLPCFSVSEGDAEGSYRVVFICKSDEALLAMDELYAGCVELGFKETETGTSTILSCDFLDEAEYAALKAEAGADKVQAQTPRPKEDKYDADAEPAKAPIKAYGETKFQARPEKYDAEFENKQPVRYDAGIEMKGHY